MNNCQRFLIQCGLILLLLAVIGLGLFLPVYYYSTRTPGAIEDSEPSIANDVPTSLRNAELRLRLVDFANALPGQGVRTSGELSVGLPLIDSARGDGTNTFYHETRLLSVTTNGFEVRFMRGANDGMHRSKFLFRFGETTVTNALGWNIVGQFSH
jgi:hypothetical protein